MVSNVELAPLYLLGSRNIFTPPFACSANCLDKVFHVFGRVAHASQEHVVSAFCLCHSLLHFVSRNHKLSPHGRVDHPPAESFQEIQAMNCGFRQFVVPQS
jgi:hypothetical protein